MSLVSSLVQAGLRSHFHACAFVAGPAEEQSVIDPFLVEGLRRGEKAVYIVDPRHRDQHEARLSASCPSSDLLEVTTWDEAYLKGGTFDQHRMLATLEQLIKEDAATGRPPMRLVGQMGWVFSSPPGIEELVAYEASANEILRRGKTPTVCVYDLRRLTGSMVVDLIRAHPLTVMNGVLHENPFYTPANEMLRELKRRPPAGRATEGVAWWRESTHDTPRIQRCVRDLTALNALPSMCVGRNLDEALDVVMEALPTVLDCDLVYLSLPGSPGIERGSFRGEALNGGKLTELRGATAAVTDGMDSRISFSAGNLFCLEAEVPLGAEQGRVIAGRGAPLSAETDRILVRTAANVVGTILQTATVLEAARRKDDFLAILGHELRNPLAPIMMAVELLAHNPTVAGEIQIIERSARHLVRLVDDLLDISRVTRGEIELRNEFVSLRSILDRAVEMAAPLLTQNRHRLQVSDAEGVVLRGDPVRLAQIFSNLLTNAAKFTPPGGNVDVLVQGTNGGVTVTVRDDGIGIARDQMDRILEPFVQGDRGRDGARGGLGLGLAIVHNLVKRHGGSLAVHSDGPGRGASFDVELPSAHHREDPPAALAPRLARPRAEVRVLIVDDNVDVAALMSQGLEREGFRTAVAHDGTAALAAWRSFLPHAGILDVGLPDLDGYQLAKALRTEHGPSATLIAATAYGRPTDRAQSAEAGFDSHLVKPVSVHDLVQVLDERVVASKR